MSDAASTPSPSINWITIGAISGLIAVGTGAFGAHGLEKIADAKQIEWWITGAEYHLLHSVILVGFGLLQRMKPCGQLAGWGFLFGILIFSGSLYAMALGATTKLGMVTPLGGTAFLLGWGAFAWNARGK